MAFHFSATILLAAHIGAVCCRFAKACSKTLAEGQALAIAITTLLTLIFTCAPIFKSRVRIVPLCARSISVPFKPIRRNSLIITYAIDENHNLN